MTLILASASPSRAAMLRSAGLEFSVQPARVDESEIKLALRAEGAAPSDAAMALAELKAQRVSPSADGDFVIAADQMLVCDGRWYDKPESLPAARAAAGPARQDP